jgi:hypothetical protein
MDYLVVCRKSGLTWPHMQVSELCAFLHLFALFVVGSVVVVQFLGGNGMGWDSCERRICNYGFFVRRVLRKTAYELRLDSSEKNYEQYLRALQSARVMECVR